MLKASPAHKMSSECVTHCCLTNLSTETCSNFQGKVLNHRHFVQVKYYSTVLVGPCHHGMARPQVADRGTASDKEGSCE